MTGCPDPDAAILRAAREARGMTQGELATRIGVTREALTCREVRPQKSLEAMRKWAGELGYQWKLVPMEGEAG